METLLAGSARASPRRSVPPCWCSSDPGSVVATLVLAGDSTPAITGADLLGISFAFGLIITALVYALGKVSGCHINPAVTFALAATKRFPWREVPTYWAAQVVGAVLGALGIWAVFARGDRPRHGPDLASTRTPPPGRQAIFAEGIGTFMLMFAILGIVDCRSPNELAGIVIGGVVVAIIMVIGPITGASLNPARAFGPELVSAIGGGVTHWAQLIPVYVLPGLVGAGLAAFVYDVLATPRSVDARRSRPPSRHPTPASPPPRSERSRHGHGHPDHAQAAQRSGAGRQGVARRPGGRARRHPARRRRRADRRPRRRAAGGQGRARLRRRLGPRAAARRVRRARDARRRVSRRGLHLAGARPDARRHQGRRRRRGRRAHRQELHGRRDELQARGRGRRGRGHRRRVTC